MQRFLAAIHQLLEEVDKQFTGQPAFIGGELERPFGIDRRGGADTLALPGSIDHRRLAALCPSLAMHRIGAKTDSQSRCGHATARLDERPLGGDD